MQTMRPRAAIMQTGRPLAPISINPFANRPHTPAAKPTAFGVCPLSICRNMIGARSKTANAAVSPKTKQDF
jgi:hypothetical protein